MEAMTWEQIHHYGNWNRRSVECGNSNGLQCPCYFVLSSLIQHCHGKGGLTDFCHSQDGFGLFVRHVTYFYFYFYYQR